MYFGEDFLQRLTSRLDIVDVVSKTVRLERRGTNYFGLCPFHNEKTPSFSVSPDRQIFKCFGCGAGGGVINFVMRSENLEFQEAVVSLAEQVNLPLPEDQPDDGARRKRLERFFELNADAARHFRQNLLSEAGRDALTYIKSRGLSPETVTKFGLGFSLNSWDDLMRTLLKQGYSDLELSEIGLTVRNERGGMHDRFRNRLMFPIIDARGRVIGFGGRVMDDSMPKYLNSTDSQTFNKSRNLYGLNIAKNTKQDRLILAEGYMDVIALHQAGFDCAVASLGTSLTADQARLLGRYTKNVCISYDADTAGKNAAKRAIEILKPFGYNIKVVRIPDGKDPDGFIKKHGARAYETLLSQSEQGTEYRLSELADDFDFEKSEDRVAFVTQAAQLLASCETRAETEVYAAKAAELARVSVEAVLSEIGRVAKRADQRERNITRRKEMNATSAVQPPTRGVKYENIRSARAEEGILLAICSKPALFSWIDDKITTENFSSPHLAAIFLSVSRRLRADLLCDLASLSAELTREQIDILSSILFDAPHERDLEQTMKDCTAILLLESERAKGSASQPDPLMAAVDRYRQKKGFGG